MAAGVADDAPAARPVPRRDAGDPGRSFRQALLRAVQAFRRERAPYMLIGAWALGLWGRPRATLDLDFMERNVQALARGTLALLGAPAP